MSEQTTGVPGGEGLGEHHAERLAARATARTRTSASRSACALALVGRPCPARCTPRPSTSTGADLLLARRRRRSARQSTCSRSASKARSSTGRPLRSTAWPTKTRRSGSPGRARRSAQRVELDAVGDHAVARRRRSAGPSTPRPRRPRCARAGGASAAARRRGCRCCSSGRWSSTCGTCRPAARRRAHRVPARVGHDRLVQVHDVVAANAELAAQRGDAVGRDREVRHRAVGRECRPCARAGSAGRAQDGAAAAAPRCRRALSRSSGSKGRERAPRDPPPGTARRGPRCGAVTPPGYVHE